GRVFDPGEAGRAAAAAGAARGGTPPRPGHVRRRIPAGRPRPLGDRPRQLRTAGDPQRDPVRCARCPIRRGRAHGTGARRGGRLGRLAGHRFATYSPRRRSTGEWSEPAMTREEALDRVRGILVEQLGVDQDQVVETASFQGDLDADSLDLVELIMELEDQFDMKISDEDAQKIETVGQAVDYVTSHS